ncbi:hypothetical protein HY500_00725 [Candidatus Woesearchaeota archaeon]|nr:hypothetical protein [Candidatus Woesearchaeota archaeon]
MDKRSEESSSSAGLTVVGLVLFAIVLVLVAPALSRAWFLLFSEKEDPSQSTKEFYTRLSDTVAQMKEGTKTEMLFSLNEDFVLVGLRKDQEVFSGNCDGVSLEIKKQLKCKGKGCICLCEKNVFTKDVCVLEGDICMPFEQDVVDTKSDCGILFVKPNVVATLAVKKEKDSIYINSLNSKELAN